MEASEIGNSRLDSYKKAPALRDVSACQKWMRVLLAGMFSMVVGNSVLSNGQPVATFPKETSSGTASAPQIVPKRDPLCRTWYEGGEKVRKCLVFSDDSFTEGHS